MTEYTPTPVEAALFEKLDGVRAELLACHKANAEVATLNLELFSALSDLYDEQNGTPLLGRKEEGWVKAMHQAEKLQRLEHRTKAESADYWCDHANMEAGGLKCIDCQNVLQNDGSWS